MTIEPCPTCGLIAIPRYEGSVTAVLRPENPMREEVMRRLVSDAEVAMWQKKARLQSRNYERRPDLIRENVARGKLLGTYEVLT